MSRATLFRVNYSESTHDCLGTRTPERLPSAQLEIFWEKEVCIFYTSSKGFRILIRDVRPSRRDVQQIVIHLPILRYVSILEVLSKVCERLP